MTQIPEEIKHQVQTSSLYGREWLEVDILVVGSSPIGCTFARQDVEVKNKNFTLSLLPLKLSPPIFSLTLQSPYKPHNTSVISGCTHVETN